jgi:hypothetical protein
VEATQTSKEFLRLPMNVYSPANRFRLACASSKPRSISHVLALIWTAAVVGALLVVLAHNTVGFGSGHGYLIEEWVYDFVTMSAALGTLWRAAARKRWARSASRPSPVA